MDPYGKITRPGLPHTTSHTAVSIW
ncbi:hypothetical protein F383_36249 [Gossypium arboreum]|uniref:Uncharacterized protein n=1 Tax=Gossypium arboreum TaxID=29729 RepID=A0A0B0NAH7_GOSAR|nr:hypothetical protein F383_36249 [Gossypium arboreum]